MKAFVKFVSGCPLATLGLVVLAGCVVRAADEQNLPLDEQQQTIEHADRQNGQLQSTEARNVGRENVQLQGKGPQASEKFNLEPGLVIFKVTHDGESNLVIRLLNRDGKAVDTLFNQIGEFSGQRGFTVREGGEYLLDVVGDGNWTVSVDQPRPTQGQAIPRQLAGWGFDVTPFVQLNKGLVVFKIQHRGDGRFTVNLMDHDGRLVESLINTLDNFDGSRPVSIEKPGIYFLNVGSPGNWTIDVQ